MDDERARHADPIGHGRMEGPAHEMQRDLREKGRQLRAAVPDVYRAFGSLHEAATAEGALPASTKELIALALSVQAACDGCVAAHARAAVRLGASEQEAAEAIGVAVLMGGGPATVQGPRAYATFREFAADRRAKRTATAPPPRTDPTTRDGTGQDRTTRPTGAASGRAVTAPPARDLAGLLHDLAVANDYHPELPRRSATDRAGSGADRDQPTGRSPSEAP